VHCVTINVKDILGYKAILIKDQISLINAGVSLTRHYPEQGSPSLTFAEKQKSLNSFLYDWNYVPNLA
jgi:hypothetical protein